MQESAPSLTQIDALCQQLPDAHVLHAQHALDLLNEALGRSHDWMLPRKIGWLYGSLSSEFSCSD